MEARVHFISDDLTLEGLLQTHTDSSKGVVVTHPHPLYGGDMHNPVVETIVQAYGLKGYTTLRFNFRGTGGSQGRYDNGRGEQNDLSAAIRFLREMGMHEIGVSGYSFGAWVNGLFAVNHQESDGYIMVSPPVGFMDFESIRNVSKLKCVVVGALDDIAPLEPLKKWLSLANEHAILEIVPEADHFYSGCLNTLKGILGRSIE